MLDLSSDEDFGFERCSITNAATARATAFNASSRMTGMGDSLVVVLFLYQVRRRIWKCSPLTFLALMRNTLSSLMRHVVGLRLCLKSGKTQSQVMKKNHLDFITTPNVRYTSLVDVQYSETAPSMYAAETQPCDLNNSAKPGRVVC